MKCAQNAVPWRTFCAASFGFCIQHGDELVAWAFSEYNTGGRCEVGIATVEEVPADGLGHGRGIGAGRACHRNWLSHHWLALLGEQHAFGCPGARRAGFEHRLDYPVELFLLPAQ